LIFKHFICRATRTLPTLLETQEAGTAAVVDPQRNTYQYIAFAAEPALKIKYVAKAT